MIIVHILIVMESTKSHAKTIYLNCANYRTVFLVPPPQNRILYQNVTIIRSRVLKKIPIKLIIFGYPPPQNRILLQNGTIFRGYNNLHN